MKRILARLIAVPICATIGACMMGPDYVRPQVAVPQAFKEATPDWQPAQPADGAPRGPWWQVFHVEELDRLEEQAAKANQNIAVAEANYRRAVGVTDQAVAALFPTLSVSAGISRSANPVAGLSTIPLVTYHQLTASASWVPDLWGAVRRNIEEQKADEESSKDLLGNALLSLQSTLATDYFALRVDDEQQRLLEEAVKAYQRSLELTESRYRGGVAARTDVVQAQALLEATKAQAIDVGIQRAQTEHAIAVLLGKAPSEFSIARQPFDLTAPTVPAQVPSVLLQRRPDVASAERLAAAANAQIGVAQAAFFPTLTLPASGGFRAASGTPLLQMDNRFWTLGPTLAELLFDAGARSAAKQQAIAGYDAAVATYRQTVLTALQNVEDQLVALRLLEQETAVEDAAVEAAEETLRLTINQYKAGTVSYLNVITAQTTALTDHITALTIRGRQLAAAAQLIAALGGDWRPDAALAPSAQAR